MAEQVVPSRMNLALYKAKIISAKKGHELLKKKCDALKTKFRIVMVALLENKKSMGDDAQEALLLFAKAQYAAGEFHQNVKDAVKRATIRLEISSENIAGVMLPEVNIREVDDSDSSMSQIGLARGGQSIQRCRDKFKDLLVLLIKIASFQTSFVSLDQVIKVTNRRVNALEYVVIPRFTATMNYIDMELDEMSKEDFFRLKKVLDNKRKIIEKQNQETAKRQIEVEDMNWQERESYDMLAEEQPDEDVFF
ncbi:unnamed protein product [Paramecium sonneborni]|uniref:Vacuolar ATP synthase subunit D n=1 Tax=Paramecium sonneborni TaxID=65129 RepID=A0A8S1LUV5_9CILI|nr:unnamed protein product [Paramecium sonneborni]CAD8114089.1 unnamed protein product [Paramecium sonneborni]